MKLANFVEGQWASGTGDGIPLVDPVRGTELARASSEGIDYGSALRYARDRGGSSLRQLTYSARAGLLRQIADVLAANREHYYRISMENSGSPKGDAAIDIEGAIYTLKYYSQIGAPLGDTVFLQDGSMVPLGRDDGFQALHIATPLPGVAILINAFNFPAWGLWEKAAAALLAGVPVLAKPATATAWLAHRMVEDVLKSEILPEGALSLVCGSAGNLLDHVTGDDAIAFTGSAETAGRIRSHSAVTQLSARTNIEADSLNVAILGPDVQPAGPEIDLLAKEIVAEMTIKAGQKCTAIRRVLVPSQHLGAVTDAIHARLSEIRIGDPRNENVRMGPLVNKAQQSAVRDGIARLLDEAKLVWGGSTDFALIDADARTGAFVQPTLLECVDPQRARLVHEIEVFGPVVTAMPYTHLEQALDFARAGGGSLVASLFTSDLKIFSDSVLGLAPSHGRLHVVTPDVARTHTGHGNVMPMSLHGGPGRAGGGQELGGLRALRFYNRFTAVQAPVGALQSITSKATSSALML